MEDVLRQAARTVMMVISLQTLVNVRPAMILYPIVRRVAMQILALPVNTRHLQ